MIDERTLLLMDNNPAHGGQAMRWLRGVLNVGRLQLLLGGNVQEQLVS
jgi:hypothetical protein